MPSLTDWSVVYSICKENCWLEAISWNRFSYSTTGGWRGWGGGGHDGIDTIGPGPSAACIEDTTHFYAVLPFQKGVKGGEGGVVINMVSPDDPMTFGLTYTHRNFKLVIF